jgi:predicted transcriptional regulator
MEEKKGFRYVYTKEKYESYKNIPAWQKLEWLEKMNRFLYNFMPRESKILAEKLRRGEI